MATTINADTSTGGAIVTGDASGVLELQSAGSTKLTVNGSGVALSAPLPVASGGTGATSSGAALTALGAQATLVSGTNIKTVNGGSVLGAGNLVVGGGAWEAISTITASSGSTVTFSGLSPSNYAAFYFLLNNVKVDSGSAAIRFRVSTGGAYLTSGYQNCNIGANTLGSTVSAGGGDTGYVDFRDGADNFTNGGLTADILIIAPGSSQFKSMFIRGETINDSNGKIALATASARTTGQIVAVQFYFPNFESFADGTFRLYGLKPFV
jgi:hypothetical protein